MSKSPHEEQKKDFFSTIKEQTSQNEEKFIETLKKFSPRFKTLLPEDQLTKITFPNGEILFIPKDNYSFHFDFKSKKGQKQSLQWLLNTLKQENFQTTSDINIIKIYVALEFFSTEKGQTVLKDNSLSYKNLKNIFDKYIQPKDDFFSAICKKIQNTEKETKKIEKKDTIHVFGSQKFVKKNGGISLVTEEKKSSSKKSITVSLKTERVKYYQENSSISKKKNLKEFLKKISLKILKLFSKKASHEKTPDQNPIQKTIEIRLLENTLVITQKRQTFTDNQTTLKNILAFYETLSQKEKDTFQESFETFEKIIVSYRNFLNTPQTFLNEDSYLSFEKTIEEYLALIQEKCQEIQKKKLTSLQENLKIETKIVQETL